jgi:hypothetical protein
MLDLSIALTVCSILWILLTIFLMIPSIYWGLSQRIQKRGHVIALLLLFWALFQSTLTLNRWYMDKNAGWFHHAYPYFFMLLVLALLFLTPRGKEFVKNIHPKWLILPQFTRIGWMIIAWNLANALQLPSAIFLLGIGMEMMALIPMLYVFFRIENSPTALIRLAHGLAILITLSELVLGYGSIPSQFQFWSILQPNYAFQHFPFSLIPSVVFPIYLFGNIHGLLFPRVGKQG